MRVCAVIWSWRRNSIQGGLLRCGIQRLRWRLGSERVWADTRDVTILVASVARQSASRLSRTPLRISRICGRRRLRRWTRLRWQTLLRLRHLLLHLIDGSRHWLQYLSHLFDQLLHRVDRWRSGGGSGETDRRTFSQSGEMGSLRLLKLLRSRDDSLEVDVLAAGQESIQVILKARLQTSEEHVTTSCFWYFSFGVNLLE